MARSIPLFLDIDDSAATAKLDALRARLESLRGGQQQAALQLPGADDARRQLEAITRVSADAASALDDVGAAAEQSGVTIKDVAGRSVLVLDKTAVTLDKVGTASEDAAASFDQLSTSADKGASALKSTTSAVEYLSMGFGALLGAHAVAVVLDSLSATVERLRGQTAAYGGELDAFSEQQGRASSAIVDFAVHQAKLTVTTMALDAAGLTMASGFVTLLSRVNLYAAGIGATVGVAIDAIHATDAYAESHKRLSETLAQTNNVGGITATMVEDAARRQELVSRSLRAALVPAAEAVIRYKNVTAENLPQVVALFDDLSAKTGKSLTESAQKIGAWVEGGTRSFADMAAAGVHVGYALEQQAAAYEKAGDRAGVTRVILDAVAASVGGTASAMDSGAQAVHRLDVAYADFIAGVGQQIGPFVEKIRAAWAWLVAPLEWPRDLASNLFENLSDHLGGRSVKTQLDRDTKLLETALAERNRAVQAYDEQGGMIALDTLNAAEQRVAEFQAKVARGKSALQALGADPDATEADSRRLRGTLDDNARAFDAFRAKLSGDLKTAIPADLPDQIKAINAEFEKSVADLEKIRNADGSNSTQIDVAIEDARRLADARIAAAKDAAEAEMDSGDAYGALIDKLVAEAERLRQQRLDQAIALVNSSVQAGLLPTQKYERQVSAVTDALALMAAAGRQLSGEDMAALTKALHESSPAFQEAKKAAEQFTAEVGRTAQQISGDWSKAVFDGLTNSKKSQDVFDWFKTLFKRIAVAALSANIMLPITTTLVNAVPGLFGISAPAASGQAAALAGQAAGQTGGLSSGNLLSLGSKFMPSSWTSGITSAIDQWGMSTFGFGSAAAPGLTAAGGGLAQSAGVMAIPGGVTNAAVAPGAVSAGLTSYLGPLGGGFAVGGLFGPLLANGNKAVGGLAGGASGAAAGALIGSMIPGVGTLVGALLGGASGGLGGLLGTQKPTVGPNAQGNVVVENGRFAQGPSAADNGGDVGPVQQATAQVAAQFNALIDSFGLKTTGQNFGFFTGGDKVTGNGVKSVDDLVKAITAGGVTGSGLVGQALQSDKVKSLTSTQDIATYLQLAKSIEGATAGLASLDKSLAGIAASAKKAAADTYKAVDDELAKAGDIGLGDQYKAALAGQIRSTFEGAAQSWTPMETAMAQVKGQTDALVEAVGRWGLSITESEIRADAAAKVARLRQQAMEEYSASLYEAQGRGYLTSLSAIAASQDTVKRNLTAVGVADAGGKAETLVGAQLQSALSGLNLAQLADAAKMLGGTVSALAETMRKAAQATAMDDLRVRSLRAQGLTAQADDYERRLAAQRAYLAAEKEGYDAVYLAGLKYAQTLEDVAAITARATEAQQASEDLIGQALRGQGLTDQADDYERGVKQARAYLAAEKEGRDSAYLAGLKYVQWLENVAVASDRAAAALQKQAAVNNANADIFQRAIAASGNTVWAAAHAFDLSAAKQREEAWNNGLRGQDLATLDTVLAAERSQTVFQAAQQAYLTALDRQIQAVNDNSAAARASASATSQFVQSVQQALRGRLLDDKISPLSSKEKLDEATRQVESVYAKAKAGDEDARGQIVALLNTRDQLSKNFWESTNPADFWDSQAKLESLGLTAADQLDSSQQLVKLADQELKILQQAKADAAALGQKSLFSLDSLHSTLVAANDSLQSTLTGVLAITGQLGLGGTGGVVAPDKGGSTAAQASAAGAWMADWFGRYNALLAANDSGSLPMADVQAQGGALWREKMDKANALPLDTAVWTAVVNAAAAAPHGGDTAAWLRGIAHDKGVPMFAGGGVLPHIPGLSTPGVDSVPWIGMPGEGVVNVRGMDVLGVDGLAALNAGRWPANDAPLTPVLPIVRAPAATNSDGAELLAETRQQNRLLGQLLSAIREGDVATVDATRNVAAVVSKALSGSARLADPVGLRKSVG